MKLNNRGWGIREMLLLSSILIFFFGVAIYFIYTFYDSLVEELSNVNCSEKIVYVENMEY